MQNSPFIKTSTVEPYQYISVTPYKAVEHLHHVMDDTKKQSDGKIYKIVSLEEEEINEYCKTMPPSDETSCGIWLIRGKWLQSMANKKVLILLVGITSCVFGSTYSYYSSTITTMEKRFKIPTKMIAIISSGNDITKLFMSIILNYYGSKGSKPKWIAISMYCAVVSCVFNAVPHFVYGPGEDALSLTTEYGSDFESISTNYTPINNQLCIPKGESNCFIYYNNSFQIQIFYSEHEECNLNNENLFPIIIWFVAQILSGMGGVAIYSLGFSYLDDNINKSKSPMALSII
jgi:hypothetical protein